MKLRHVGVCLLLCLAPSLAQATFPAPMQWVLLGTNAQNPCTAAYSGGPCFLFDTALDAGTYGANNFCAAPGTPSYWSGTSPNEYWRVGNFYVSGCTGSYNDVFVKQVGTACPLHSSPTGSDCGCDSGYYEVEDDVGRMACEPPQKKDNGKPCPACGNPINPGNGNKFERQEIYRSAQGLEFSLVYNSQDLDRASFGYRWRGFYDRRIKIVNSNAVAYRPDGRAAAFVPSGGSWTPDDDVADRLTELTSGGVRTGWVLNVADGDLTENYNADGKLTSIVTREGRTFTFAYSDGTSGGANGSVYLNANGTNSGSALPAGMLIKVTDDYGRTLSFWYYPTRNVGRVTRPGGGDYKFVYDVSHRLTSITWPDTRVRTYVYNESAYTGGVSQPYALTGIVDENGERFATFQYDAQGRAVSTAHAGGANEYTIAYNTNGSADVTDALGASRNYTFQNVLGVAKSDGITGAVCPSCGPKAQTFDTNGNVATRTDWNGNRTDYTWDTARNLETARTEALTSTGSTTPQTRTISTQWHSTFRLPTLVAEPLRLTTNVYDPDGSACGARGALCSRTVQATTDANGSQGFSATTTGTARTWTYTYNANGRVLTVNGPRTDVTDTTTYTYHANNATCAGVSPSGCRGLVATITNAAGHVTQITQYTSNGEPILIVGPNGLSTTLGYDARHRLTSRNVGGETTTYTYDYAGLLTRVTLPDGSYLNYTYDDAHRITQMEDNLGNRIVYTLDDMGNRTAEEVRDPSNNLVQTRSRVYSSLNRLFQEIGAATQTTEYTYDDQGNVLTVNGPLSGTTDVTTNQYDALNRLKQVTDPSSGVTQYAYNGLDALTQVTDPRSLATAYTVDGLGNLTQQVSPDTGTTANTYDAAGNLLTQTDAKSQVTTYSYDALNRVTQILFHDSSKQIYGYDSGTNGIGRLTSIEERNPSNVVTNTTTYAYDQKGRVTSIATAHAGTTHTVAYSYDSAGRLSGMTYPSGRTLAYGFDSLGRVSAISTTFGGQTQPIVANVAYHPFGGVKSYTLGNGQSYARSYDQDGRINSYSLAGTSYAVLYDLAGRIETITETLNPPNTNTYGYDVLDRLTSAAIPGTSYGYTYDAVGNRLTRTAGASTDTYAYGSSSNRIASITPPSGPVRNFTLDANGSTTADGNNTYGYDIRGRMVQAVSGAGTTDYKVNALGQRMRKTNSATDTVFHYDSGGRLIAETSPSGTLKREIIYLGDIPVAVVQ